MTVHRTIPYPNGRELAASRSFYEGLGHAAVMAALLHVLDELRRREPLPATT